jgi:hypothetical protein
MGEDARQASTGRCSFLKKRTKKLFGLWARRWSSARQKTKVFSFFSEKVFTALRRTHLVEKGERRRMG